MDRLEKLQSRWKELAGKPKKPDEIEETLQLAKEIELELAKEYKNAIDELKQNDIFINSIWDLVNMKQPYPKAIDILIKYLKLVNHDKNKEGFARALTVKEAKGKANKPLLYEYEHTQKEKENLRWIIGNAIATVMTIDDIPWLLSSVQDKSNGKSRGQLVRVLGTLKTEMAEGILIKLLEDDDVVIPAIQSLVKMKSKRAKEGFLKLSTSSNKDVKREALLALKKN